MNFLSILSFLLIITCTTTSGLMARLEEHFKKAENKGSDHSMRNIDFMYVINLDKRPEKFRHCVDQLKPYGLTPYRFSAVNGWELPFQVFEDIGVRCDETMPKNFLGSAHRPEGGGKPIHEIMIPGRTYFCHGISRGVVGIVLSHLSVLQDAYDSGYKTVWVMEDDIEVIRSPLLLSGLIDKLDALVGRYGWDILFTDKDTKGKDGNYITCLSAAPRPNWRPRDSARFARREIVSPEFRKIGARYGAYSFIIRRSGMRKILNFIKKYKVFLPYDMEFYLPEGMRIYTVNDDVVSTLPQALSDNTAPRYQKNK